MRSSVLYNICKQVLYLSKSYKNLPRSSIVFLQKRNYDKKFEPSYLDPKEPEISEFPLVNIQITGYDFTTLEHYGKWVYKIAVTMGLDVLTSWASPCKDLKIVSFKPKTSVLQSEFKLHLYQRTVQLCDAPSTTLPLFIHVIQAGLPEGVEVCILEHMPEHTEERYIPDIELKELKQQLEDIGGPSKKIIL